MIYMYNILQYIRRYIPTRHSGVCFFRLHGVGVFRWRVKGRGRGEFFFGIFDQWKGATSLILYSHWSRFMKKSAKYWTLTCPLTFIKNTDSALIIPLGKGRNAVSPDWIYRLFNLCMHICYTYTIYRQQLTCTLGYPTPCKVQLNHPTPIIVLEKKLLDSKI